MKLAVNLSMIFTEVPLIERFALAAEYGFQHVEIQFPYELSIEQIQHELNEHQLSLCLINVPAGDLMQGGCGLASIPSKTDEFKQAVDLAIEYACSLNVPRVNILAGKQPDNVEYQICYETLVSNLKFVSEIFTAHGIQPVFEMINGFDMPNFMIQTMHQAKELLKDVNHPALKMQFDCYHMARMQEDLILSLKENMQHIGHIQFADVPGRHEPLTGTIDYPAIFECIANSMYEGFVAAEYRPQSHSTDSFEWKNKLL